VRSPSWPASLVGRSNETFWCGVFEAIMGPTLRGYRAPHRGTRSRRARSAEAQAWASASGST
ncbi:hypothetical protein R0J90_22120, partial [Micrococcus sp. SIMBA_144]